MLDVYVLALIIFATVALVLSFGQPKSRRETHRPSGTSPKLAMLGDASNQLRHVMSASFSKQRLMSPREYAVFRTTEKYVLQNHLGFRVMAQTSLGEILQSNTELAYRAINSKRVDLLIVDGDGFPVIAIEYQGDGHHQGNAAARDAVKREALRRAGIGFVEVFPGHDAIDICRMLADALRRSAPVAHTLDEDGSPPTRNKAGPRLVRP